VCKYKLFPFFFIFVLKSPNFIEQKKFLFSE